MSSTHEGFNEAWDFIHRMAAGATTRKKRIAAHKIILLLQEAFFCDKCCDNLTTHLKNIPPFSKYNDSNVSFLKWTWILHDEVNKMLTRENPHMPKKSPPFEKILAYYLPGGKLACHERCKIEETKENVTSITSDITVIASTTEYINEAEGDTVPELQDVAPIINKNIPKFKAMTAKQRKMYRADNQEPTIIDKTETIYPIIEVRQLPEVDKLDYHMSQQQETIKKRALSTKKISHSNTKFRATGQKRA